MTLHFKFIDSNVTEDLLTNSKLGCRKICSVTVELEKHQFTGTAVCHPEDYFSEFSGCKLAEIRARRKAIKFLLSQKKKEFNKLENFLKGVEHYKGFDKESKSAKCVYRQFNRYKSEIHQLEDFINYSERTEKEYIKNLDELNKKRKAKEG